MRKGEIIKFSILTLVVCILLSGCGDEISGPPSEKEIPSNLFPLSIGNIWLYSGYKIDTSGTEIENTKFEVTRRILERMILGGKEGYVIVDSFKNSISKVDTLIARKDDDSIFIWLDLSRIVDGFRYENWALLMKPSERLNEVYTIFNLDTILLVEQEFPVRIKIKITGKFTGPENIQTPAGEFKSYKLEKNASISVSISGATVINRIINEYIWLAPDVGIVKYEVPGQNGIRFELVGYTLK